MEYPFVVIEGYSDEGEPRRCTKCETLEAAAHVFREVLVEIAEDYMILRERDESGELRNDVFGWMEGKRKRYCAVRRNASVTNKKPLHIILWQQRNKQ